MKEIHTFDNGVKVYDYHLLEAQRKRYKILNVHEEDEEDIFLSAIGKLESNACYVNVGTAIGYYPLLARKKRKDIQIHCFEPLPSHLRFFRENIDLNNFDEGDFNIQDVAVSTKVGKVNFKDSSYSSSVILGRSRFGIKNLAHKLMKWLKIGQNDQSIFSVKSIRLSDVFKLTGCTKIDFLQMDIQGLEQKVLNKYFLDIGKDDGIIKSFLIGTHSEGLHNACRAILIDNGYEMLVDEQDTKNQPDGIIYCRLR